VKSHLDPTSVLTADGHIEEDNRLGHF
jgi:hypothetical protein